MARDDEQLPDMAATTADDGADDNADEPTDEGIIHDEYTDDNYVEPDHLDALDVTSALAGEDVLTDVADESGDGIEEIDITTLAAGSAMDTVDSGMRRGPVADVADMGLGTEPRTADELADAAVGHELRGRAGMTRDDQVHGEALFDEQNGERDRAGM